MRVRRLVIPVRMTQREYLVQNAYQAVRLALEQGVGATTTDVRDQDTRGATLPAFSGREQDSDDFSRIANLPQPRARRSPPATLHALQEWEGYVTEINDTEFSARLTDLTSGANYAREEADIPLVEISEDDAAKMQVGSIFRWVIGYERAAGSKKAGLKYCISQPFRDYQDRPAGWRGMGA